MKIKCKFNKASRAFVAVSEMRTQVQRVTQNTKRRDDPFRDGTPYGELEHRRLVNYVAELRRAALHKLSVVKPLPPSCAT